MRCTKGLLEVSKGLVAGLRAEGLRSLGFRVLGLGLGFRV